jgi:hypothetical protein
MRQKYQYGFEDGFEVLLFGPDTTRCEVLTAVYLLMMVFLDMTRCSLRDARFRRNMLLTFSWQETTIMKMEAAGSFDTFVPICQFIKRHISED